MEENLKIGEEEGDICNRNGCLGTLYEQDIEGGCSCHSNPPCSYCTEPKLACDECDWTLKEELYLQEQAFRKTDAYKKQQAEAEERAKANMAIRDAFYNMYHSKEIATEFKCVSKSHTHFSMEVMGYFPPTMTMEKLLDNIKGTFGGRFTYLDTKIGRFNYIAYTD